MRRKMRIILVILGFTGHAFAQAESENPLKFRPAYYGEVNGGMLALGDLKGFAHLKNGVSLTPHLDLAFGLGLEGHTTGRYLPIFFEGRYNFLSGKTRPFVSVNAGYLQVIQDRTYGNWNYENKNHIGLSTGGRLGVQQQFAKNIAFVSSIGYRFSAVQYVQEYYDWWSNLPVEPVTMIHQMHRFELSIGLIFK